MKIKDLKTLLCDLPDDEEVEITVKAVDIEWDTDGEDVNDLLPDMDIPLEVAINDGEIDEDAIGDYISKESGFCHYGFNIAVAVTKII